MTMHDFSVDNFYNLAVAGYRYELRRLVSVVLSDQFRKTLPTFIKKKKLAILERRGAFKTRLQNPVLHNGFSMQVGDAVNEDWPFYHHIDLAAACSFFEHWTIPVAELNDEQVEKYLEMSLAKDTGTKQEVATRIAERLNRADTMRVSMALKLLGLLPHESYRFKQLSLGAFLGNRDIEFMHQQPTITPSSPLGGKAIPPLTFGTTSHDARDIVLVDLDPSISQRYAELNLNSQGRVLAINDDVLAGLNILHSDIEKGNKKPRDLVVLFRLEPMMLPNVDLFFEHLSKVIDHHAKFIMTVGAGDDNEAYRQRKDKMDEIGGKFSDKGFRVERLKWCNGETPEEQRERPLMGIGNYCSYDIIYSEIVRDKL